MLVRVVLPPSPLPPGMYVPVIIGVLVVVLSLLMIRPQFLRFIKNPLKIFHHLPPTYTRMPYDKLFIKITCTYCRGTCRVLNNREENYTFPRSRWKGCIYCDGDGMMIIEASDASVEEFLKQLPESRLKKILEDIK